MDIYKHSAVSLTVSLILLIVFKKVQLSISCFVTGIFVDMDHLFDYVVNRELREKIGYLFHPGKLIKFLTNGYKDNYSVDKLYKPFHSIEFIIFAPLFYALGLWNPVATGITVGFLMHLIMDSLPLGHIGSISLVYKISKGFPTGSYILRQRLIKNGRNVNKCQICGVESETIIHKDKLSWYVGFTKRSLKKIKILCEECHDKIYA
jgi:hypothetical protein